MDTWEPVTIPVPRPCCQPGAAVSARCERSAGTPALHPADILACWSVQLRLAEDLGLWGPTGAPLGLCHIHPHGHGGNYQPVLASHVDMERRKHVVGWFPDPLHLMASQIAAPAEEGEQRWAHIQPWCWSWPCRQEVEGGRVQAAGWQESSMPLCSLLAALLSVLGGCWGHRVLPLLTPLPGKPWVRACSAQPRGTGLPVGICRQVPPHLG